jgi:hypothetical protein
MHNYFMRRLYFFWVICIAVVFTSCSTGNKFASSFGKRRYTKGYYVDVPSSVNVHVAGNTDLSAIPVHPKNIIAAPVKQIQVAKVSIASPVTETNKAHVSINAKIAQSASTETLTVQTANKDNDNKKVNSWKGSDEINFFAIAGFIICCVGVAFTIAALNFTTLSLIILGVGISVCIYSLFLNKIYWNWLAAVGISLTIILFVLLLL